MTNVFAVVGEHRDEPTRLLLVGDDGRYYAYATNATNATNATSPTEVEPSDEWAIDDAPDALPDVGLAGAR